MTSALAVIPTEQKRALRLICSGPEASDERRVIVALLDALDLAEKVASDAIDALDALEDSAEIWSARAVEAEAALRTADEALVALGRELDEERLLKALGAVVASIQCPACGSVSYNLNDVTHRYCGNCHAFHDDLRGRQV